MANAFKTKTFDGSSTALNTDMTIYTCPASTETTIIGMTIANIGTAQITVDVKLENSDGDNVLLRTARSLSALALCQLAATRRLLWKRPTLSRCSQTRPIAQTQP